jgi:hypothetical protein
MPPESIYQKILHAEKESTIQEIIDRENSKQIRVHMPCKVVAVNGATVDVEIQGMEDTGYGYYSKFPPLLDLPIIYNNYTSSAYIITPVQVGDTGLVEFLDFNATNFTNDGNTALTTDQYYHSINNGSFINGYIPTSKQIDIPINKPIVMGLKNKTFTLEVGDGGDLTINSLNSVNIKAGMDIVLDTPNVVCTNGLSCQSGASGTFQAGDKSVTVLDGIIVSIE